MSKLITQLNTNQLENNRPLLVPSIFTKRQFGLVKKKLQQRKLTLTEQVYFSRTINKKLKAISSLTGLEKKYFISGEEKIIPKRKEEAIKLLKKLERNHKNIKILIAGSFLHNKKFNDIDVFFISKYEKEDHKKDKIHFNYLPLEALDSLFFNSLKRISIANFNSNFLKIKDKISLDQIISKYQEIVSDIDNKNYGWLKIDLRDFVIDCNYASKGVILNSLQLKTFLDKLLRRKNKAKLIEKLFIYTVLNGFNTKEIKSSSLYMINAYKNLMKEYKHKRYYQVIINTFKEVLSCAS
jgi:hypothetical protein